MKRTLHIFRNQQAALDQLNKDLNKYRKVRFLGGVGIEANGDEHWYMASYAIEHRLPGLEYNELVLSLDVTLTDKQSNLLATRIRK